MSSTRSNHARERQDWIDGRRAAVALVAARPDWRLRVRRRRADRDHGAGLPPRTADSGQGGLQRRHHAVYPGGRAGGASRVSALWPDEQRFDLGPWGLPGDRLFGAGAAPDGRGCRRGAGPAAVRQALRATRCTAKVGCPGSGGGAAQAKPLRCGNRRAELHAGGDPGLARAAGLLARVLQGFQQQRGLEARLDLGSEGVGPIHGLRDLGGLGVGGQSPRRHVLLHDEFSV